MLFFIALLLAIIFTYTCQKSIKKHSYVYYAAAVVITIVVSTASFRNFPAWINTYVIGLFERGAFATALWCAVMWTGAFSNGSGMIKKYMPIRGEISIIAAILTLGHNISYGRNYFVRMVSDAGSMPLNQLMAGSISILMLFIMLPLTVISFPKIRKKMKAKLWKRIQRIAYVFYALLYIHIMLLCIPVAQNGRSGYLLNVAVYSVVFIGYAVCRIRKWLLIKRKAQNGFKCNTVCSCSFLVIVLCVIIYSKPYAAVEGSDIYTRASNEVISHTEGNTYVQEEAGSESYIASGTDAQDEILTGEQTELQSESYTEENIEANSGPSTDVSQETQASSQPQDINVQLPVEGKNYTYRNGTYTASAFGYDGDIDITISIDNDIITSISGVSHEGDTWYYETAKGQIFPQILSQQSCEADAVSGATYSSMAILDAVRQALSSAKN